MESTVQRPARISGWIPVAGPATAGGVPPNLGGLTDISRTGARLYLSWVVKPGEVLNLGLKGAERGSSRPGLRMRVVWVRQDRPGDVEALESRMRNMRAFIQAGAKGPGTTYGYLVGARFDANPNQPLIRAIQKHFEESGGRPRKRAEASLHLPEPVSSPAFRPAA